MARTYQRLKRWLRRAPLTPARRRHALVGPAGLWKMKRAFQIAFLKDHGLLPDHSVLDVGCGTLRGGIPVIEYLEAGGYVGVDVREKAITEAWTEVGSSGVADRDPALHVIPDVAEADLGRRFDVVWAFQVVTHMTDDILIGAAAFIERHLAEGGHAFVSVRVGERRQRQWRDFPAMTRPLEHYEGIFGEVGLAVTDIGPLTSHGHVLPHRTVEQQSPQRMMEITRR